MATLKSCCFFSNLFRNGWKAATLVLAQYCQHTTPAKPISPSPANEGQRGVIWSAGAIQCLINLSWNKVTRSAGPGPRPISIIGLYVLWEEGKTDYVCTCVYAAATPVCPLISIDLVDHNLNDCIVIVWLRVMICHQPPGRGDGWLLASTLRLFTGADWILVAVGG